MAKEVFTILKTNQFKIGKVLFKRQLCEESVVFVIINQVN